MKRLHVHISVQELQNSVRFYSALFGAEPTVLKDDYAKWMLEDPRVNFAVSTRSRKSGLDHLGIQVEDAAELKAVHGRLQQAGGPVLEQGQTTCCYARSEKNWTLDPQGLAWETFLSLGEAPVYGQDLREEMTADDEGTSQAASTGGTDNAAGACCTPKFGLDCC